jgi:predicted HicB family RNase H-like nuclease
MTKSAALSIRISEELKQAIEKAAAEDGRSVASFVERTLQGILKEKGYLK